MAIMDPAIFEALKCHTVQIRYANQIKKKKKKKKKKKGFKKFLQQVVISMFYSSNKQSFSQNKLHLCEVPPIKPNQIFKMRRPFHQC